MVEDKDLEQARNNLKEFRLCDELYDRKKLQTAFVTALKAERKRLLNDPRIKALVELVEEYEVVLNGIGTELATERCRAQLNYVKESCINFESLLKENE